MAREGGPSSKRRLRRCLLESAFADDDSVGLVMARDGGPSSKRRLRWCLLDHPLSRMMTALVLSWPAKAGHPATAGSDGVYWMMMTGRPRRNSGAGDLVVEIDPVRIFRFNEFNLPGSIPALEALFPPNCRFNVGMRFEIDESMYFILFCEAGHCARTMFIDAAHEIIRDTDVKRAPDFAGKDVDPIVAFNAHLEGTELTGSSAFADDDTRER
jgi:hypothetical protein